MLTLTKNVCHASFIDRVDMPFILFFLNNTINDPDLEGRKVGCTDRVVIAPKRHSVRHHFTEYRHFNQHISLISLNCGADLTQTMKLRSAD